MQDAPQNTIHPTAPDVLQRQLFLTLFIKMKNMVRDIERALDDPAISNNSIAGTCSILQADAESIPVLIRAIQIAHNTKPGGQS